MTTRRRFELSEGKSNKFWEIWAEGSSVFTNYGRIGSNGQTTQKDLADETGAQKLFDKLVREKTGKGYVEQKSATSRKTKPPVAAKPAPVPAPAPAPSETVNLELRPAAPVHFGFEFSFDESLPSARRDELNALFSRFTTIDSNRGFVVLGPKTTRARRLAVWKDNCIPLALELLEQQLPSSDVSARTAQLERALARPSGRAWAQVVMLLSTWPEDALPAAIKLAVKRLESWPPLVRATVDAWTKRPELASLVRTLWGKLDEVLAHPSFEHATALRTQDHEGLLEHHARLAHLTHLDLSGSAGLGAVVEKCTGLTGLTQLVLMQPSSAKGEKIDLAALLAAPHLKNLNALSLYGFTLSEKDVEALADGPQQWTRIRLQNAQLKPAAAQALARIAATRALISLDLKYNSLGPKGAQALFENPDDWKHLRVLDLSANEIGDDGAVALAAVNFESLRWLNLSSNDNKQPLKTAAAVALAEARLPKLEYLNLHGHPIKAKGVAALVESQTLRSLRSLCVGFCSVNLAELSRLCGKHEPVPLEEIDLGSSSISGAVKWSAFTFLRNVNFLGLESLSGKGYGGLLEDAPIANVEYLALDTDYAGDADKGFEALCAAAAPAKLHFLKLSGLKMTEAQAKSFAASPIGRQVHGVELMTSYTSSEAWDALTDGGVPLAGLSQLDWTRATEFAELTPFREEW